MKKLVYLFAFLISTAILFSSCEKCTICTRIDQLTGEEVVEEFCGSGGSVTDFENDWIADWDSIGGYCARN